MVKYNYSDVLETLRTELLYTETEYSESFIKLLNRKSSRIFITAAGRSKMIANMFAMRLMHCDYSVHVVGETTTPSISKEDTLLVVSGSGETQQLIAFTEKAKVIGAKILLVTGNITSTLKNIADHSFLIGPSSRILSNDKNLLPLGSRFELASLIFFETMIINIMSKYNIMENELKQHHANLE